MHGYGTRGRLQTLQKQTYMVGGQTYILIEYIKGGPFYDFCKEIGGMGESIGRLFMNQLIDVMSYLHDMKNIVHRDLKLENIMITSNLKLKLSDFGLAKKDKSEKLNSYIGTQPYMAPEIIERKTYNGKKADIFALGVILYIIVIGRYPFKEATKNDFCYKLIKNGKHDEFWE